MLEYLKIKDQHIVIPTRTYVSVPNQIILSGNHPLFEDYKWNGFYQFGGDIPIIDYHNYPTKIWVKTTKINL